MADLTTNLPDETLSEQRFIPAAPATPSPLTSIFDFATNVAGVADRALTTLGRNSANANALADKAAQDYAVKAATSLVFPVSGISTSNPNVPAGSQQAYTNAQPLAAQAATAQQAGAQGKLDPSMVQARTMSAFRQALAANPGHEYAVFQAFKEMGISNMLTQQYDNAERSVEAGQTAIDDAKGALIKDAVTKYGYSDFDTQSPANQALILAKVGQMNAQENDLDAKVKLANLTQTNQQITQAQRDDLKKQGSNGILGTATTYMTGQFGNVMKLMINQLGDPTLQAQPGRLEQLQSHFMNVALPALDLEYQTKRAQLVGVMTPDDLKQLDQTYQDQRTSMVNMISGPQSVVEMNKRVLENISTSAGIDYAKSAPTLMKLQKMVGPQAIGVLLSPSVQGNKQLMDLLTNELNGVISDPTKMPSFTEFVQSLNGTVDPATWDPEKSRAMAPALLASTSRLAMDTPTMNGTDKQSHQMLMNSIKNTAGIAVDVVPQWGFGNVLAQSKILNTRGITTSLFNTGSINQGDKIDAIHAWLPATTRSYEVLSNLNSGDQFYSAQLDPHTLQWKAVWNGQKISSPNTDYIVGGLSPGGSVGQTLSMPKPSSAVLDQVATLNHMLNNLAMAGSHNYDDTIKGSSYQEARRYFATGEIPQSIQKPAASKNGKTPEQNVDDAINHMLDFVNKLQAPKPVESLTNMPLASTVQQAAAAHGVPTDIALRLIHQESGGNPDVKPSSKGAIGPGQIMPATAKMYGKDVTKLSPEENVDLAMQILADNYKKTGNWEDAVSMYHSGRTLADAVKHNSNDGNISTAAYTAGIAGPSQWSNENLARYGYVRY